MRIILIGPRGVGKSTVAEILSDRLEVPHAPMDHLRFGYYAGMGYDARQERLLGRRGGFPAVARYWKPFEAYAVGRILADYPEAVIDFGAGHSHYDDSPELFEQVRAALANEPFVVLLLPTADDERNVRILHKRNKVKPRTDDEVIDSAFIRSRSNRALATHVVLCEGRTPPQVAEEIVRLASG